MDRFEIGDLVRINTDYAPFIKERNAYAINKISKEYFAFYCSKTTTKERAAQITTAFLDRTQLYVSKTDIFTIVDITEDQELIIILTQDCSTICCVKNLFVHL